MAAENFVEGDRSRRTMARKSQAPDERQQAEHAYRQRYSNYAEGTIRGRNTASGTIRRSKSGRTA